LAVTDPIAIGAAWLRLLLAADNNLRALLVDPPAGYTVSIFDEIAPQELRLDTLPADKGYVTIQSEQGADDTLIQSRRFVMAAPIFLVKYTIVGPSANRAALGSSAIENAIAGQVQVVGSYKLNCYRRQAFKEPGADTGKQFRQAGARYEVRVRPVS
jgi:hypothetical protein